MVDAYAQNIEVALSLASSGFSVFPCHSGGDRVKQPMPFIKWREVSTFDERQIRVWWQKWPDAAVGLDLAKSSLIVIDCDRHDVSADGVQAYGDLVAMHGADPDAAPMVATPSHGNHIYFRQPGGKVLGNSRGALPPGIDVRGSGGYVIAPGTTMQDGRYYELFGNLADAPELPDWIVTILHAQPVAAHVPARTDAPFAASDEMEELLSHIPADCGYDEWLSVLMAIHAQTNGGGFAIADRWSAGGGKNIAERPRWQKKWASFRRDGISGATLAEIARRYGADLSAIAIRHMAPEHDPVEAATAARRLIENHDGSFADAETGEIVGVPLVSKSETRIDYPPGLVGDIARWMVSTSLKPQPALAIGAALTIVGAIAGRQFTTPVRMGGTVLYVLGLAPTAQGKEVCLDLSRRIFKAAALPHHLGPDEFMSFTSVISVLTKKPLCLAVMDEFGDFLRKVYSRNGSPHVRAIPKILRTVWGKNFGEYASAEWAEKTSVSVSAPHLSIFAGTTHEQFYGALEGGAVADGTLNRFLIIEGIKRPRTVKPLITHINVPDEIVRPLKEIYSRSGDLAVSLRNDPAFDPVKENAVIELTWCPDGSEAEYERFRDATEDRMFARPEEADLLGRVAEMAVRIATIVAIGRGHDSVRIDDMRFGINLASQSAGMMIKGAESYMAENETEANWKKIIRFVQDSGGRVTYRLIQRHMKRMNSRQLKEMISGMCEAGSLAKKEVVPKNGGHVTIYYLIPKEEYDA